LNEFLDRGRCQGQLLGGAVFLIPAFLAVFVIAKVFAMLKSLAVALSPRLALPARSAAPCWT